MQTEAMADIFSRYSSSNFVPYKQTFFRYKESGKPKKPRGEKEAELTQEIPADQVNLSPVPASLWLQLLMIPSIFKRLDCLLKAAELRDNINIGTLAGNLLKVQ